MPIDAPELTLSASLRAWACCRATATTSTVPVSGSARISVVLTAARTEGVSRLTASVPAAAAATRPKLAAAASTSALAVDWPSACTRSLPPTRISVLPASLPATGAPPLRSMKAWVEVAMVLYEFAPPPARLPPMLTLSATATA